MQASDTRRPRADFVLHRNGEATGRPTVMEGASFGPGGPRVSIVIPTADGDRYGYLDSLLEQIREQTYQNLEVIVVKGDTRQGRAINFAAALARGEFILTFDDDSSIGTPQLIQRLLEAMDSDPRIGMAGCENRVPVTASWFVRRLMAEVPRRSSGAVRQITDSDMAEHPCLMMRKSVFYQVGGEHEVIARGLDPYLRREFRAAGYRVVVVPDVWIHHLPPPTFQRALRQFFRNGRLSALVSRKFPELALDNALAHGEANLEPKPVWFRAARHAARMGLAAVTFKWIYLATSVAYGAGVISGIVASRRSGGGAE